MCTEYSSSSALIGILLHFLYSEEFDATINFFLLCILTQFICGNYCRCLFFMLDFKLILFSYNLFCTAFQCCYNYVLFHSFRMQSLLSSLYLHFCNFLKKIRSIYMHVLSASVNSLNIVEFSRIKKCIVLKSLFVNF